jgi:hypothetical protein
MRDNFKQIIWFGVPAAVAGAAFFVYHSTGSKSGDPKSGAPRGLSSVLSILNGDAEHGSGEGKKKKAIQAEKSIGDAESEDDVSAPIALRDSARRLQPFDPLKQLDRGGLCSRVELKGSAPGASAVTREDWSKVIAVFHDAKEDLAAWLGNGGGSVPRAERARMIARMSSVKIQRPPAAEEPDLSWRGIGVLGELNKDEPLVRVGTGFVRLVNEDRARAKFEVARLLAQTWAPCELAKAKLEAQVWSPLLKCLKVTEDSCADQSYSEAGWAISTSIASAVAPLACAIPAFADPQVASCAKGWLTADAGTASHAVAPTKGSFADRIVASKPVKAAHSDKKHETKHADKHEAKHEEKAADKHEGSHHE